MAKVGIERCEDGSWIVRLDTPYFLYRFRFKVGESINIEEFGRAMARGMANAFATGFDAGVVAERIDHGQTEFIYTSNDLTACVPEDPVARANLRERRVSSAYEDEMRVHEWIGPKSELTGQPTFMRNEHCENLFSALGDALKDANAP